MAAIIVIVQVLLLVTVLMFYVTCTFLADSFCSVSGIVYKFLFFTLFLRFSRTIMTAFIIYT